MSLKEQVKIISKSKGIKYKYIADKVGVANTTFSAWLHNNANLTEKHINNLKKYLTEEGV